MWSRHVRTGMSVEMTTVAALPGQPDACHLLTPTAALGLVATVNGAAVAAAPRHGGLLDGSPPRAGKVHAPGGRLPAASLRHVQSLATHHTWLRPDGGRLRPPSSSPPTEPEF